MAEKRARKVSEFEKAAERARVMNARVAVLVADIAALDRALAIRDPALNPSLIGSVNGWQGRYGKRGALREAIVGFLQGRAPDWVTTNEIGAHVTDELGIAFDFPKERVQWHRNSLLRALNALLEKGTVEREAGWSAGSTERGRWRWKQDNVTSLAELRANAS
jgi:hypothetical protein